jgi:hypothetical protein
VARDHNATLEAALPADYDPKDPNVEKIINTVNLHGGFQKIDTKGDRLLHIIVFGNYNEENPSSDSYACCL